MRRAILVGLAVVLALAGAAQAQGVTFDEVAPILAARQITAPPAANRFAEGSELASMPA